MPKAARPRRRNPCRSGSGRNDLPLGNTPSPGRNPCRRGALGEGVSRYRAPWREARRHDNPWRSQLDPIVPYCGPAPENLLTAWNLAPLPLALCAAPLALAFLRRDVPRGPAALAAAALFLAFVSPLCALTVALFSARGLHHLVLVLIAAPALALAFPLRLPFARMGGFLGLSLLLWLWHLPAAYTLAWNSHAAYWLMQAGLLGSGFAFWSSVFRVERPAERVASVGLVLALAGQMGLIGAILTFSPRLLYLQHLGATDAYGLSALADQQLAGLIMWVPGMLPLALIGALLLRRGWREASAA